MVIYEYEVPGGALNVNSTNYPDHGDSSQSGKISHGRAGNRTRDLIISSQKRWSLDHEAGRKEFKLITLWFCQLLQGACIKIGSVWMIIFWASNKLDRYSECVYLIASSSSNGRNLFVARNIQEYEKECQLIH
jgi:hypothetical protein